MTTDTNLRVLAAARDAWLAAGAFRLRRDRYKRYTYGDQWSDIIADSSGRCAAEADLIAESGRKPLTNNMIRQIVKIVIGRYRSACRDENIYAADKPSRRYVGDNALLELDCRMLEEFLISGCAVQRIAVEKRRGVERLWIDNVDPRTFFVNSFKDPRGNDIELIGMLHDMSFPEIVARFAGGKRGRAAALARSYAVASGDADFYPTALLGEAACDATDFFNAPAGRCRAIETWTLDCRRSTSRSIDFVWQCRWFTPDGALLASYDSPYPHGSHPFAIKLYPLTDGEVHSFVEDVIDQQRCINRMIVLIDHIIGSSAKGVLLFPQDQKPKEVDWKEVADTWSRSNGVIPITGAGSQLPQQVVTSSADCGAYQLDRKSVCRERV